MYLCTYVCPYVYSFKHTNKTFKAFYCECVESDAAAFGENNNKKSETC